MEPLLDILVILDRSGSMQGAKQDHEGGLRAFVDEQRKVPGAALFTLIQFDDIAPCEVVYDRSPLGAVGAITLNPRGGTPLLDAIGRGTAYLEQQQHARASTDTVVMIVTDGQENSSREWTRQRVKQRLAELERKGWRVIFLGANIDSFAEAGGLGVARGMTMNFNNISPHAINSTYATMSSNMGSYRGARAAGASVSVASRKLNVTEDQRKGAMGLSITPDDDQK